MSIAAIGRGLRVERSRARLEARRDRLADRQLAFLSGSSPFYSGLRSFEEAPIIDKRVWMERFDEINTRGLSLDRVVEVALEAERSRDFSPTIGDVSVGLSSGTSGSRGVFLVSDAERDEWSSYSIGRLLRSRPPYRIAFFLRSGGNLYGSLARPGIAFRYFDLSRPWDELAPAVSAFAPTIAVGPPRVLALLGSRVRQAVAVAEQLHDDERSRIDAGRIDQVYQATEGLIATSCAHGTLHLHEDYLIVEREPVGEGFVPIITDLRRRTQPVVRYRLDDILVPTTCGCGDPRAAIARIDGREDDAIRAPRGVIMPDLLRRSVIVNADLREYRVRYDGARVTVELDPYAPVPAIGEAVRSVFSRFGLPEPEVRFAPYVDAGLGTKRRRVVNEARGSRSG